ncbi:MAG: hypothetical protein DMG04_23185 [Acidobacteria bacterium]|nr:MAG: hypothetical protein DMG04_23185 [Acidobacteriota bacterium]
MASSARNTSASTEEGFTSSARLASAIACGGFSSDRTRADPISAGAYRGSTCSAIWNDRSASVLLYFSRNSSPQAVWITGSFGAADAASRYAPLASWNRPSARSARPARATSFGSLLVSDSMATRSRIGANSRPSICIRRPSCSAASLVGNRETTGRSEASASAYRPRAIAARARSATTLGSRVSSFSVSVSTSA